MLPLRLVLVLLCAEPLPGSSPANTDWHRLIGILQYIQDDYPAALKSGSPSELQEQRAFSREAVAVAHALGSSAQPLFSSLESLSGKIASGSDPEKVRFDVRQLVDRATLLGGVARSPPHLPNLDSAAVLYQSSCAACHGSDGAAKTPVADQLVPHPTRFDDPSVMGSLTPYKAFNVLSFGVSGTAMPAYDQSLTEQERWSVAFYIFTLRHPNCRPTHRGITPLNLEELSNTSDQSLEARVGSEAVACLRRNLPQPSTKDGLRLAEDEVKRAVSLKGDGHPWAGRQVLLDAYLNQIEPLEPTLRGKNPALMLSIENAFLSLRQGLEQGNLSAEAEVQGARLISLLERARQGQSPASAVSVFWISFFILIREGLEASIVIAALLAVLKKMEQPRYSRVVHLGWISAALTGAVTFFFARHLIAGSRREWMEGVATLLAVGMLIYAALWLNARSNIRKWMGKLKAQMQGALGRGSALGLFVISFTAMLRETVETAVFVQGVSIDSPQGAAWGAGAGVFALVGLVLFFGRFGYRLPMKALFTASTFLLFGTAVVLLGKGLHILQEVGALSLHPISFLQIDLLGVYPDALSLLPQLALLMFSMIWLKTKQDGRTTVKSASPIASRSSN